jgi:hypothetical protein
MDSPGKDTLDKMTEQNKLTAKTVAAPNALSIDLGEKDYLNHFKQSYKKVVSWFGKVFNFLLPLFFGASLVGVMLWWFLAAIIWPARSDAYNKTSVDLNGDRIPDLLIKNPGVVQSDGQPVTLDFTLDWTRPITPPIVLTIFVPEIFDIVSPYLSSQVQINDRTLQLSFTTGTGSETQTMQLINSRIDTGWGVTKKVIKIQSKNFIIASIPVGAEGTIRGRLLRFGGNAQNRDNPLILIAPVIIAIAGAVFEWLRQAGLRIAEERKQKEQEDTQHQQKARELLDEFNRCIKLNQVADARQVLEKIEKDGLTNFLEESQQKKAWCLVDIAEGRLEGINIKVLREIGVEESAIVLGHVAKYNPTDRVEFRRILREFPVDEIPNTNLRLEIKNAREILGSDAPVQFRYWPPYPEKEKIPLLPVAIKEVKENPLAYERSEDDVPFLFRKTDPLFWPKHTLYEKILGGKGLRIVTAEPGTGKTVFALAMSKYRRRLDGGPDSVLACYIKGQPEINDIRAAFARQFLMFIQEYPSHLCFLTTGGRHLLAELLIQSLGKSNILTSLDYIAQPKNWKWLKGTQNDEGKRQIWVAESLAHLRLLREAVEEIKVPSTLGANWAFACMNCARALGFINGAEIVIDSGSQFNDQWLQDTIQKQLTTFQLADLNVILFATKQAWGDRPQPEECEAFYTLKWNTQGGDSLEQLVNWRWNNIYGRRRVDILDVFENKALLELFQQADGNPRCLIRIWKTALVQNPGKKITKSMINTAKDSI